MPEERHYRGKGRRIHPEEDNDGRPDGTAQGIPAEAMKMDKRKMWWLLLIAFASLVTLYNIYTDGIKYLSKLGLELLPILILSWIFFIYLPKEKAYKIAQYTGFIGVFLYFIFPASLFSRYLFIYGAMMVVLSILLKRGASFKNSGKTFDEKIKSQLKISAKSKVMNLPKKIGGFVMPILPFFQVTSKRWKGSLRKEAVIHENVHLYYLQNGWMIWVVIGISIINSQLLKLFSKTRMAPFLIFLLIISAVLFEQVTFRKTHEIGQRMGIVTREWDIRIGLRYFIIYALQFTVAFVAASALFLWLSIVLIK